MAKYVDGFVLVVPKDKTAEYTKMAQDGRDSWMKHGALQYFECKGDDLESKDENGMQTRSFVELAHAGVGDDVWFSFIIFESKEHRDEVNKKVMAEMGEKYQDVQDFVMPFDMSQMSYGGFSVEVQG